MLRSKPSKFRVGGWIFYNKQWYFVAPSSKLELTRFLPWIKILDGAETTNLLLEFGRNLIRNGWDKQKFYRGEKWHLDKCKCASCHLPKMGQQTYLKSLMKTRWSKWWDVRSKPSKLRWRVDGWVSLFEEFKPRCGPILKAGTFQSSWKSKMEPSVAIW